MPITRITVDGYTLPNVKAMQLLVHLIQSINVYIYLADTVSVIYSRVFAM